MLDLDRFKEVNDTNGHAAGDAVLQAIAEVLRKRLRTTDLIARIGGDEFAVMINHVDGEAALGMVDELLEQIRERIGEMHGAAAHVTVSAGIAAFDKDHPTTVALIMEAADAALYDAKRAGRAQASLAPRTPSKPRSARQFAAAPADYRSSNARPSSFNLESVRRLRDHAERKAREEVARELGAREQHAAELARRTDAVERPATARAPRTRPRAPVARARRAPPARAAPGASTRWPSRTSGSTRVASAPPTPPASTRSSRGSSSAGAPSTPAPSSTPRRPSSARSRPPPTSATRRRGRMSLESAVAGSTRSAPCSRPRRPRARRGPSTTRPRRSAPRSSTSRFDDTPSRRRLSGDDSATAADDPGDGEYDAEIQASAAREGVDPALVRAIVAHESGFNPNATSSAGAQGLMQLMPATARGLGVTDSYDPAQNIAGGTHLIRTLLDRYDGEPQPRARRVQRRPGRGRPLRRHPALRRDAGLRPRRHCQLPAHDQRKGTTG